MTTALVSILPGSTPGAGRTSSLTAGGPAVADLPAAARAGEPAFRDVLSAQRGTADGAVTGVVAAAATTATARPGPLLLEPGGEAEGDAALPDLPPTAASAGLPLPLAMIAAEALPAEATAAAPAAVGAAATGQAAGAATGRAIALAAGATRAAGEADAELIRAPRTAADLTLAGSAGAARDFRGAFVLETGSSAFEAAAGPGAAAATTPAAATATSATPALALAVSPLVVADAAPSVSSVPSLELTQPFASEAWQEELGSRLQWMADTRIGRAELRLNPPELGPLEISLKVHNDDVSVSFQAHHAATREAVEAALPRLREMLESNGLNLADANVGRDQRDARERDGAPGDGSPTDDPLDGAEGEGIRLVGPAAERAAPGRLRIGLLDAYA